MNREEHGLLRLGSVSNGSAGRSSLVERARLRQVRFCSLWLARLARFPLGFRFLKALREAPVIGAAISSVLKYNRPFATLEEAQAATAHLTRDPQRFAKSIALHLSTTQRPRPSDYAVLFHLQDVLPRLHRVLDLGGNVGNLFYCYREYLGFADDFEWIVLDVPEVVAPGERMAQERKEHRLRFVTQFEEGCDLLLGSGSIHIIDQKLPAIIARMRQKPGYILLNRTPLTEGPTFALVQDTGSDWVSCTIYNRSELVRDLEGIGYTLVDWWKSPERSLEIPCWPDKSIEAYSGLFFVRNGGEYCNRSAGCSRE